MPNIVGITKDDKVRTDLEKICQELGGDELRFAGFSTIQEFESLYFRKAEEKALNESPPPSTEETSPEDSSTANEESSAEETDLRLFSEVHMILLAEDAISGANMKDAAIGILKQTKVHKYWPEENRTRIIGLRFEEENFDKLGLLHPALDDLIFLPIDQPLLMQKLEIFLKLPEVSKPSFLFYQNVDTPVEISKIVTLEKLNDCALAIRNKTPLKKGVRGKFYLFPPSQKEAIRFFGKVFRCEPHPEVQGEYLVYFFFFGVRKREVSVIRKWLSSNANYSSLDNEDESRFAFNPDDLFATEEDKNSVSVAIVDYDTNHAKNLKEFLERKIGRLSISSFDSFALFYEMGLELEDKKDQFTPNPSEISFLPPGGLKLVCDPETKNLKEVVTQSQEGAQFCGHPMESVFVEGQSQWWKFFELKQNQVFFEDVISSPKNSPLSRLLFAQDATGNWIGFQVQFLLTDEHLTMEFQAVDSNQLIELMPSVKKLETLSTLIIDTRFVSENFEAWLSALLERAQKCGAIRKPEDLNIILISDREDHLNEEWLKTDQISSLVLKPTDHKTIAVILAECTQNKNTIFTFANLGWIEPKLRTHLSKPVQLAQLGEFGATINTSTPFKEGSFFFLRKGIFDEAPNGCLAARVYHTEPHPSDEGRYLIYTTYFGINDYFLKHARSYMREQYAAAKGKSG